VPWRLWIRLVLGSTRVHLGWLCAVFAALWAAYYAPRADFSSGYGERARGHVTSVKLTGKIDHLDNSIYAIEYQFAHGGAEVPGVSYTTKVPPAAGEPVQIELDPQQPTRSRIVGMRRKPYEWIELMMLTLPLIGIGVAIHAMVRGHVVVRLLARGRCAPGRIVSDRIDGSGDDEVRHVTYQLDDPGACVRAEVRGTQAVGTPVTVLYDPARPAVNTLSECWPGRPRLDACGAVIADPGPTLIHVLSPALAIATVVAGCCWFTSA